ncbi:uncharacterized protein METZ01_LOCUS106772, partial [marine metagenome]
MKKYLIPIISILTLLLVQLVLGEESWSITTAAEWAAGVESSEGITIEEGVASPSGKAGSLRTKMKTFKEKRSA